MKHLIKGKNNGIGKVRNAGFTLVEMIVVLTIMAIMMSGAVWGVTGWIAHYEYVSSEEKARVIYMAAQSALSAAESRGTLNEYMEDLNDEMVVFSDEEKAKYGINPDEDNEGEVHKYGYLAVSQGEYKTSGGNKKLFKLLETYVSDSEQLNGSIVLEFDLTAKKVYSAFYSGWATSITYGNHACVERGNFYIYSDGDEDRRDPDFRSAYQVGYYGVDQVNVVRLDNLPRLKMLECMLHNEETLYLTVKSSSELADSDTIFNVRLYEDKSASSKNGLLGMFGADNSDDGSEDSESASTGSQLLCSFSIDRDMLNYGANEHDIPKFVELDVYDAEGKKLYNKYPFIISFNTYKNDEGEDDHYFSIILDALITGQSTALLNEMDTVTQRTDANSFSITRLIGEEPKNIYAAVTAKPKDPSMYSESTTKKSETRNSLFATKEKDSDYYKDDSVYEIKKNRHLANIRFSEDYFNSGDAKRTYVMDNDLNWNDAVMYDRTDEKEDFKDKAYNPLENTDSAFVFPMIPVIYEKGSLDGNGKKLSDFKLNNASSVLYNHDENRVVIKDPITNKPVNTAKTLGIVGTNKGMISRLIVSGINETALSYEEYKKTTDSKEKSEGTIRSIYNDSLEAVGIICGRNEGSLREIYFVKDSETECSVKAYVFANLSDDVREAEAVGETDTSDTHLNERYGCGVGMVAGTVALSKDGVIDRIQTSGTVEGIITGTDDNFKEAPAVSESEERGKIYNDVHEAGESVSNAQYYAYGVGGVFGYVYGNYETDASHIGIGIDKDTIDANNHLDADKGGYLLDVFAADETRSIINKADVTGVSFTGGIVGNLYISNLADNKITEIDENDGYVKISDEAKPHMINCVNYGDTVGDDFVGGVIGVNGEGGYIKACESYGSPKAMKGVSAGIASENFGFMKDCLVDRAAADIEHDNKPYVPEITGNMVVAGAITSVNHTDCVVSDCNCSIAKLDDVNDSIIISGDDMDTFGYLVGQNDGVVDNGRTGEKLGYKSDKTKLIIGGAVGTNSKDAIVKNVEVMFNFVDGGQADCVGGIVGRNFGVVNNCKFGGSINKSTKSFAGMAIGGIAAKNGVAPDESDSNIVNAKVTNSYVIGASFTVKGIGSFVDTSSERQKISSSSYVGGVCGVNYQNSVIENCYVTSLKNTDGSIENQSTIKSGNGMVGGITAVNMGDVDNCGYTDNEFVINNDRLVLRNEKKADMAMHNNALTYLKNVSADKLDDRMNAANNLMKLFMNETTGEVKDEIKTSLLGTIPAKEDEHIYALPKYDESGNLKYDVSSNEFVISLNNGTGYIGGIAGYNTSSGKVRSCASGKWVVENYLPKAKYNAIGGVIGYNSADDSIADSMGKTGSSISNDINFAYVRTELPSIPDSAVNNNGMVTNTTLYNNMFNYVGGVIGTQNNTTADKWTIEKCVNVGTVLNYYGNNSGGVIAKLEGNGGTVQYSYNYGVLLDGFASSGGYSGTSGGIVAHYTELKPDQVNNVLHCQNHGVISFPMRGVDYDTSKIFNDVGKMTSNDVGGIVGEISAPLSINLYTVNIKDCVNGVNARVYASSKSAGILGTIGCYAKDGNSVKNTVNSIFVNIDTCRSYSSLLYTAQSTGDATNGEYFRRAGAINSGRDPYADGTPRTGYTTVRNCFGVRMYGYYANGNMVICGGDNHGAISYFKSNGFGQNSPTYKYCGNNYYIDELTFQYSRNRGRITSNRYDSSTTTTDIKGDYPIRSNAYVAYGAVKEAVTNDEKKKIVLKAGNNINKVNDISRFFDDSTRKIVSSERIISVEYENNGARKYALIVEPLGFDVTNINEFNSWTDGANVYINTEKSGTLNIPIFYTFEEAGSSAPYNNNLIDHFYFERMKKSEDFREKAKSENADADIDVKVNESRLPIADEYDMDYYALDKTFVEFIENNSNIDLPDKIKNVNVTKSTTMGSYEVKWDVEPNNKTVASATEFDVEVRFFGVEKGTFDSSKIDTYLSDPKCFESNYTFSKKAYGTTTTFVQPDGMMSDSNKDYYAIVRVKDARGGDEYYSDEIIDEVDIQNYVQLYPKLPTPQIEIVSYANKWMLHLKNVDDYKGYTDKADFKVHVYTLNGTTQNKTADITAGDITFTDDAAYSSNILNNAVSAETFKNAKAGQELYCVATADQCLDSDTELITAYIPNTCRPTDMIYGLTEDADGDHLNDSDNRPYYTGVLTYTRYSASVHPTVPQTFKVELYGIKKYIDEDGNEASYHETLAEREYSLYENESEDVKIGYYDADPGTKFDYDEYGIDCWYSGTGQGDVYHYFETSPVLADNKVRYTGFIKDISDGASQPVYYFHSASLAKPKVEIVCIDRDPKWYARLLNASDYAGTDAKIYLNNNKNYVIDTSAKLNDWLGYAGKIGSGNNTYSFVAKGALNYDSPAATYSPTNAKVSVQGNLESGVKVNYALDCDTFTDEDETEVDGEFTLKEHEGHRDLLFKGMLKYNSHDTIGQYYRYELYAYNDKGEAVTLFLSDDKAMESGAVNNSYKTSVPIKIEINSHDKEESDSSDDTDILYNVDLDSYHDFHVAVWYSNADLNTSEKASNKHGFAQYFEITENAAKALAYDETTESFVGARDKGLLIDMTQGEDSVRYYYVAPLADSRYYNTSESKYNSNVLYRECEETISSVQKDENGKDIISSVGNIVTWKMNPSLYGESDGGDIVCDVDVRIYEVDKGAEVTKETLEAMSDDDVFARPSNNIKASGSYAVLETTDKEYDWDNHDYYALVRVKDENAKTEEAYSDAVCASLNVGLPKPEVSILLTGGNNLIRLDNYKDYQMYKDNFEVIVLLEGNTTEYKITSDESTWVPTYNNGVQIPYCIQRKEHNISGGKTTSLKAYAQLIDPNDGTTVLKKSSESNKTIYMPYYRETVPSSLTINLSDDTSAVVDAEKRTVTFNTEISFGTDSKHIPVVDQYFCVALVGTPNSNYKGSNKPMILTRTSPSEYIKLKAGEAKSVEDLVLDIDESVDITQFKNIKLYIWYGGAADTDGLVYQEFRLTSAQFNKYKDKNGVTIDFTSGMGAGKEIYYYERAFNQNKGYKTLDVTYEE